MSSFVKGELFLPSGRWNDGLRNHKKRVGSFSLFWGGDGFLWTLLKFGERMFAFFLHLVVCLIFCFYVNFTAFIGICELHTSSPFLLVSGWAYESKYNSPIPGTSLDRMQWAS